jgi:uracil-DNA glycosylase family 4
VLLVVVSLNILQPRDDIFLSTLNKQIVDCTLCPRLLGYSTNIRRIKTKRFVSEHYCSRLVPSFEDPRAEVLIIGLAPGAHGGNRTGRMFTGDSSGDWLIKALYESKFANKQTSDHRDDGLVLSNVYITSVIRYAPPDNTPLRSEIENCSEYFLKELRVLKSVRIVLTLGLIAFNTYRRVCRLEPAVFRHGKTYSINKNVTLVGSYHPSRQNTNTGRLTWNMWTCIFRTVRMLLMSGSN